jgi:hypothetical protein
VIVDYEPYCVTLPRDVYTTLCVPTLSSIYTYKVYSASRNMHICVALYNLPWIVCNVDACVLCVSTAAAVRDAAPSAPPTHALAQLERGDSHLRAGTERDKSAPCLLGIMGARTGATGGSGSVPRVQGGCDLVEVGCAGTAGRTLEMLASKGRIWRVRSAHLELASRSASRVALEMKI